MPHLLTGGVALYQYRVHRIGGAPLQQMAQFLFFAAQQRCHPIPGG